MKQILCTGCVPENEYWIPVMGRGIGSYLWSIDGVISTPGTLSNFYVKLQTAPGTGKSWDFTLYVNHLAQTLTVNIAGTATTGSDTSHPIAVVAGDLVEIFSDDTGGCAATVATLSMEFESSTAKNSLIMGGSFNTMSNSATTYHSIIGNMDPNATETNYQMLIPCSGTVKNLYVQLNGTPSQTDSSYAFTIRKNAQDQALTCTVTKDINKANDTSNSFTVVAGDLISMKIVPTNTPTARFGIWGIDFAPSVNGQSIVAGVITGAYNGGTEYGLISGYSTSAWSSTENDFIVGMGAATLKKFYVSSSVAPGETKAVTFSLRLNKDNPANAPSVTLGAAATTGSDTSNTCVCSFNDVISIKAVETNTPATAAVRFAFVSEIASTPILKRYIDEAWAAVTSLKWYSGAAWSVKPLKVYNGESWQVVDTT